MVKKQECRKRSFIYKGVQYQSIKSCCDILGININIVRNMRSTTPSLSIQTILNCVTDKSFQNGRGPCNPVSYNGKTYRSMKQCCEDINVPYMRCIVYSKQHPELSIEEVIDKYKYNNVPSGSSIKIEYDGVMYQSIKELCKKLGLLNNYCGILKYKRDNRCSHMAAIEYYMNKYKKE